MSAEPSRHRSRIQPRIGCRSRPQTNGFQNKSIILEPADHRSVVLFRGLDRAVSSNSGHRDDCDAYLSPKARHPFIRVHAELVCPDVWRGLPIPLYGLPCTFSRQCFCESASFRTDGPLSVSSNTGAGTTLNSPAFFLQWNTTSARSSAHFNWSKMASVSPSKRFADF